MGMKFVTAVERDKTAFGSWNALPSREPVLSLGGYVRAD
jgi:hypothetical protein